MIKPISTFCLAAMAALICSCSSDPAHKSLGDGWTIKGTINDAADKTLYVEASKFNNWYLLDSLVIGADGTFSFQAAQPDTVPSVYRLRMGDRYIYFPADGAETITLDGSAKDFSRGYKLSGTKAAADFSTIDSLINSTVDRIGVQAALSDSLLKQRLNLIINRDTTCIVSYYIIGKFIGGTPYYDLTDSHDIAILGNAANNFAVHRPKDIRAEELLRRYQAARAELRRNSPNRRVREIQIGDDQIIGRPKVDMRLYDRTGRLHDFDRVASAGKVTILNFTRYDGQASPANTVALNKIYEKYGKSGVQIYQVAFDPDEIEWRQNAANMPWTSVWATPEHHADIMMAYNVNPVDAPPVSFVINRKGEIVERVSDPDKLDACVAAQL